MKPGFYTGDHFRGYSGKHTLFRFDGEMLPNDIAVLTLVKVFLTEEDYYSETGRFGVSYNRYLSDIKTERKVGISSHNLIPFYLLGDEVPL